MTDYKVGWSYAQWSALNLVRNSSLLLAIRQLVLEPKRSHLSTSP